MHDSCMTTFLYNFFLNIMPRAEPHAHITVKMHNKKLGEKNSAPLEYLYLVILT